MAGWKARPRNLPVELDYGLCCRQTSHWDPEGGAADVVHADLVAELDGVRLAAVLAADADLEIGFG